MNPPGNERGADSPDQSADLPEQSPIVKSDSTGEVEFGDDEIADFLEGATDIRPFFAAGITRVRAGPLPIADEYAKYELATPGAGEDIRNMAKTEQRNQHERRMRKLRYDYWHRIALLVVPAVVVLMVIAIGGFLVYQGRSVEGLIGILFPLASVLGVFVYRNPRRTNDDGGSIDR